MAVIVRQVSKRMARSPAILTVRTKKGKSGRVPKQSIAIVFELNPPQTPPPNPGTKRMPEKRNPRSPEPQILLKALHLYIIYLRDVAIYPNMGALT